MAHVIEMPKLSDTMEEGAIAKWLKTEGEAVREGEALVEIETDKATQEYEAPEGGVLLKILVPKGKTVALRVPIAVIGTPGESYEVVATPTKAAPALAATKAVVPPPPPHPATVPTKAAAAGVPAAAGRLRSSPLARKVAAAQGMELAGLQGSGPGGRIVVRDLAAGGVEARQPALPATAPTLGDGTVVPVSMMRKTIAKRLTAAKNDAPHFYLTVGADVGRLESWRQSLNAEAGVAAGTLAKVSLNDLIILAVAKSLRLHPAVNSSWRGDEIFVNHQVHVALAVALEGGLVTPVIRNTDALGVRAIAKQARDLAAQAKSGALANDAYSGGTFTISNLGMFGIEEFTAIINPPQAAILAVGAAAQVPWVDAKGQLVVRQRLRMTLSCDHRVVDGATGAQFLKTLVGYLEEPLGMLA